MVHAGILERIVKGHGTVKLISEEIVERSALMEARKLDIGVQEVVPTSWVLCPGTIAAEV